MGKNRNGTQSSGKTEWETPPALVAAVAAELGLNGFDLDPAATKENKKGCAHFGPGGRVDVTRTFQRGGSSGISRPAEDGLAEKWFGNVWLNPPYGHGIGKWAAKAHQEVLDGHCTMVAALLPTSCASKWWQAHVMDCTEMWMLDRRVTFLGQPTGAPFDSVIIVWRANQLGRRYLRGFGWKDDQGSD